MQFIFLPTEITLVICFILWPVFQFAAAYLCLKINDRFFQHDTFIFRSAAWEKRGKIYDQLFRIRRWKRFLPDGAALFKNGFRKKHLASLSRDYLAQYLIESCRAELGHWVAILPFWVFGFFTPFPVVFYMLAYAIIINLPCILAQRYNRPRFFELLTKTKERG